jgi:F5/8 type C domain-containing protein
MTASGRGRRFLDWYLLAPRAREAFARGLDREQKDCLALARGADGIAQVAAQENTASGPGARLQGALLALHAETAYWALRALVPDAARRGQGGLRGLVERVGDSALDERMGSSFTRELTETLLLSHDEIAALDAEQLARVLERAASVARKLLETAQAPEQAIRSLKAQRVARVVAIPALCGFLLFYLVSPRDLARGKSWHASSSFGGSPVAGLLNSTDGPFFFHTNSDAEPWIVVDIGRHTIHKVVLTNRRECCQERATPLVIEAIGPGSSWRVVARKDEPFTVWTATFVPLVASQIRVRALRPTYLHLADIEVF